MLGRRFTGSGSWRCRDWKRWRQKRQGEDLGWRHLRMHNAARYSGLFMSAMRPDWYRWVKRWWLRRGNLLNWQQNLQVMKEFPGCRRMRNALFLKGLGKRGRCAAKE